MKNRKINPFLIAYIVGLLGLAGVGYFFADYTIKAEQHSALTKNQHFATDVAYVDLPRMSLTLVSFQGSHTGRIRMDISLAVEKRYAMRLEGYQPRISDRIVAFTRQLDFDKLSEPKASAWLRQKLLQEVNNASTPLPVMDIVFRQFVIL